MNEMRSVDRLNQNALFDELDDIGAIDDRVECEAQLIALVAGPPFG